MLVRESDTIYVGELASEHVVDRPRGLSFNPLLVDDEGTSLAEGVVSAMPTYRELRS